MHSPCDLRQLSEVAFERLGVNAVVQFLDHLLDGARAGDPSTCRPELTPQMDGDQDTCSSRAMTILHSSQRSSRLVHTLKQAD